MQNSNEKLRKLRRGVSIERVLLARDQREYAAKKIRQEKREKIKALARNLVAAKKNQ